MLFLAWSSTIQAEEEIKGVVTKIIDGNTIEVTAFNQEVYTMMLLGIDSPDPGKRREELGDFAMQFILQAILAEEKNEFTLAQALHDSAEKLIAAVQKVCYA